MFSRFSRTMSFSLTHEQWQEKRVFYLTPQTLMSDLLTGLLNAEDVILIVFGAFLPPHSPHRMVG